MQTRCNQQSCHPHSRASAIVFFALVEALSGDEGDSSRGNVAAVICEVARSEEGLSGGVAAGGGIALVEVLKVAEEDKLRRHIVCAMYNVANSEEGRAGVVAAGGCSTLVDALNYLREYITGVIYSVAKSRDG